ncbi:glycosyltransferase family 39 protein [Orrella marina]|uniref:Glycosyl transferase n=1 Tax=Orrella marina TaxID=2163011 RepID=A0A2R4XNM0_9BURK|nr:glycosyltransferase family 39 protein [Orrella marina]AWB35391.1 glycosyl transferase [Orrella marina]
MFRPFSANADPRHQTLALIVLGLVIHAGFAGLLTLSVDEAHYALYGHHLALSYFDHPPMVGWVQWPLVALNAPDWALRLIPQVLWLVSVVLAWRLAEALRESVAAWKMASEPGEPGRWAVLMILLAPVLHVLAVGLLPDTLVMALVLGLMLVTLRICHDQGASTGSWIWLGVLLGLAGLSKYTAILFALAVAGMLWINVGLRVLTRKGPWVAMLIAVVLVSPVFYWNATHDWISFQYQVAHSSGGHWRAYRLLAFVGLQIVAFGPLVIACVVGTIRFLRAHPDRLIIGLWLFFLIPFAVTAYMSGGGRTLPHWMAPAWLVAIVIGANPVSAHWNLGRRKLLVWLARVQAAMCTIAFAALFFIGIPFTSPDHPLNQKNPLADLWGWDKAGEIAKDLSLEHQIDTLSVGNWTLASRLAWYSRPLPVVVLDERFDQFDIWFGDFKAGQDTIFVNWSQAPYDPPVGETRFEQCDLVGHFNAERFGRVVSSFDFLLCRNWQES